MITKVFVGILLALFIAIGVMVVAADAWDCDKYPERCGSTTTASTTTVPETTTSTVPETTTTTTSSTTTTVPELAPPTSIVAPPKEPRLAG